MNKRKSDIKLLKEEGWEIISYAGADSFIQKNFKSKFHEITKILSKFQIPFREIMAEGGGKHPVNKRFSSLFLDVMAKEKKFKSKIITTIEEKKGASTMTEFKEVNINQMQINEVTKPTQETSTKKGTELEKKLEQLKMKIKESVTSFLNTFKEKGTLKFKLKKKDSPNYEMTMSTSKVIISIEENNEKTEYDYHLTTQLLLKNKKEQSNEEVPSFLKALSEMYKKIGNDECTYSEVR